MPKLTSVVAVATVAVILASPLWIETAAVAQVGKPPGKWCPAGGAPLPSCKGFDKPRCLSWAHIRCGRHRPCLKWTCRKFNPPTREPFKRPQPLPGSPLR
jgi:hypothetical protein